MNTSTSRAAMRPALAASLRVSDSRLTVRLTDGREISAPLADFPRLAAATQAERRNWKITARGTAIRWPDIDEDIGLAGLLGVPESLLEEAAGFKIHAEEPRDR